MSSATIDKKILWLVFGTSLIVRMAISLYTPVGVDEMNFYKTGLPFYSDFTIPARGQLLVYTGAHIPGSLQPLMVGTLLLISKGAFWILPMTMAMLNTLAAIIIYRVNEKYLFPSFDKLFLALFIAFTPWSIINVPAWNPSVLPFFVSLFLLGMTKYLKGMEDFSTSFLLIFPILFAYQFHLSAILLVGIVVLTVFFSRNRVNWKGLVASLSLGGVFYIPLIFAGPEVVKKSVVVFNLANLKYFFKIFLRFTSYLSFEFSHFFSKGRVLHLPYMDKNILSSSLYLISMASSLFVIFLTFRFYSPQRLLTSFKNIISFKRLKDEYEVLDAITILIPIMTTCAFIFSVKPPSTHTFWILFPFAYYPLFKLLKDREFFFTKFSYSKKQSLMVIYSVLISLYSFYGMQNVKKDNPTVIETLYKSQ